MYAIRSYYDFFSNICIHKAGQHMYEDNLLFKIAWYYYFDNMTQQQISDRLGISYNFV